MWKANSLILVLGVPLLLSGGSLRIFNDSPYPLQADIMAADGSHQGSLSLTPQHQSQWQDGFSGNAAWSQTPYTIILRCKNGKQFGIVNGVGQGGTVSVMSARGPLFCEQDKSPSSKQQSQQNQPFNPNQTPADPSSAPNDPIWGPP